MQRRQHHAACTHRATYTAVQHATGFQRQADGAHPSHIGAGTRAGPQDWGKSTGKTLVNRLLHKKAIASERAGGRHAYRALVARADYVQSESQGLLDRLFEGRLEPLISHFAKYRDLTPAELKRLKRLVEDLENGK